MFGVRAIESHQRRQIRLRGSELIYKFGYNTEEKSCSKSCGDETIKMRIKLAIRLEVWVDRDSVEVRRNADQ